MKTSISQSSELLISLLSPLVRTVCHWFALEPPSLLIAPLCTEFIIIIFIFSFLLSRWCMVHNPFLTPDTIWLHTREIELWLWTDDDHHSQHSTQHYPFSLWTIKECPILLHQHPAYFPQCTMVKKKKEQQYTCMHLFPPRWLLISGSISNQDISLLIMASSQLLHIEQESLTLLMWTYEILKD